MKMLDLCSGLGGASEAMVRDGWEVIRVDNNPVFNPDICIDIRELDIYIPNLDLAWLSFPCTEFAREFLPWCKTGVEPDMSIFLAGWRIIQKNRPRFWVVENVKGAIPYVSKYLGNYRVAHNPWFFWGYFPDIGTLKVRSNKEKLSSTKEYERSKIPFEISRAFCLAVKYQETLF